MCFVLFCDVFFEFGVFVVFFEHVVGVVHPVGDIDFDDVCEDDFW